MDKTANAAIRIRPLAEADLAEAERVFRLAFGTRFGAPDPETFANDREFSRSRYEEAADLAFAAELDGALVGANFGVAWGSVGFFGPLSVRPDLWDRGVGRQLVGPVLDGLDARGCRHLGLFTFPESTKHIALYQRFGFWPRFLTALMSAPVGAARGTDAARFSQMAETDRAAALAAARALTEELYPGLDLAGSIRAADAQGVGETLFLFQGSRLAGLALCRFGPRSEAGADTALVKFAATRAGDAAAFERLIAAARAFAAASGIGRVQVGVNTSRHRAYRRLLELGFRADIQGVTMHRPNDAGYDREDAFILDDWR